MRRRTVLAGASSVLSGLLSGCEEFDSVGAPTSESVSRSYEASRETLVAISNRNGDVTVRAADGNRVQVSGEKRARSQAGLDSIDIEVVEGERFIIDVRFGSGSEFESRRVDLTVEIPTGASIDTVSTANGSVTIRNVRGNLRAVTANGTVELSDVSGYVSGESGNGDVRVRNTTGLLGARTTSGDVDVDLLSMREDVTCRAGTGDVTVRVGPAVSGEIRLSTARGIVTVEGLPYTPTTERRDYIVGRLRGGESPLLMASSADGNITLRPSDGGS